MFIASRDGLHEMVQLLIEGGADIDFQCETAGNQTSLIISTANEHHKVVKLLLKVKQFVLIVYFEIPLQIVINSYNIGKKVDLNLIVVHLQYNAK